MAGITHTFVNPKADGGDATITRPSDWNAEHTVPHLSFTTTKAKLEAVGAINFTPAATVMQSWSETNTSFAQILLQNKSAGTGASGDIVVTTDTGSDTAEYIDLGINSSGYTGTWGLAKDGYLYVDGGASGVGDLVIGTAQVNTFLDIQIGGGAVTNRVMRFDSQGALANDGPVNGMGRDYAGARGSYYT